VLEELDADGYARGWMERARRPILELFDRGTYLDAEDVEGFLALTLPGVDEVAGVLRLGELSDEDFDRIVVDTAPTGHTLRLLDAGEVVRSWSVAFDAMAEKAAAVIGQLTRRPVRLEADDLIEDLEQRVARFGDEVLKRGQAVLVERGGSVVEAESGRLQGALVRRSLPVALRVCVGCESEPEPKLQGPDERAAVADPPARVSVPFHPGLEGCDGLHGWGRPWQAVRADRQVEVASGSGTDLLRGLPPLLLFVGKGGVGKSTCAAAAALSLSQVAKVSLLGTDPAASLGDVLDLPMPDGEAHPTPALTVRQVRAAAELASLTERYHESVERAFESIGGAALDRRVLDSLMGLSPPGLDEVFAVAALLDDADALSERRRVIVDTAPTGHFLRLLGMPEVALGWTRQLLRVLHKYRAALGLDAFAERLLDFAKQLKVLKLTLSDPERSAVIVVTQPGPLVTVESRRLLERVSQAGVRVGAVISNRTDVGSPTLQGPPGAASIRAPTLPNPPVGVEALQAFLQSWTVEAAQ
jgi:arsenite-transporting ATPase